MSNRTNKKLREVKEKRIRRKRFYRSCISLALVAVLLTVYALIQPAATLTPDQVPEEGPVSGAVQSTAQSIMTSVNQETVPAQTADTSKVETQQDILNYLQDLESTGEWNIDAAAVAGRMVGYRERTDNYAVQEDGTVKGYTFFGDIAGDPYADWNVLFAEFVMEMAGADAALLTTENDATVWAASLEAAGYYTTDFTVATLGDLAFWDGDGDGTLDHVGIICDGNDEGFILAAGDSNDQVELVLLAPDQISGYGLVSVCCAENKVQKPMFAMSAAPRTTASAAEEKGSAVLDKKVKANEDGSYTIRLEAYITATTVVVYRYKPVDVVLILDTSGSMKDPVSGSSTARIDALRTAATSFIDEIASVSDDTEGDQSQISVVEFNYYNDTTYSNDYFGTTKVTEQSTKLEGLTQEQKKAIENAGTAEEKASLKKQYLENKNTSLKYCIQGKNDKGVKQNEDVNKADYITYHTATATEPWMAFEYARQILYEGKYGGNPDTENRQKIVVFFTDGAPTDRINNFYYASGTGCTKTEHVHDAACYNASGELTCAQEEHIHGIDCTNYNHNQFTEYENMNRTVAAAHRLKNRGTTVYSIGCYTSKAATSTAVTFLSAVSSDNKSESTFVDLYPVDTVLNTTGVAATLYYPKSFPGTYTMSGSRKVYNTEYATQMKGKYGTNTTGYSGRTYYPEFADYSTYTYTSTSATKIQPWYLTKWADDPSGIYVNGYNGTKRNWSAFMPTVNLNYTAPTGTSQYYFAYTDASAASITEAFSKISQSVITYSAELDKTTILKDVISDNFMLAENTISAQVVSVYSLACETVDANGNALSWKQAPGLDDPALYCQSSIGDFVNDKGKTLKCVSVTNYDYKENWVGKESNTPISSGVYPGHGRKLVVEVLIYPKNARGDATMMETNDPASGIYEKDATKPLNTFPQPEVALPCFLEVIVKGVSGTVDLTLEDRAEADKIATYDQPYPTNTEFQQSIQVNWNEIDENPSKAWGGIRNPQLSIETSSVSNYVYAKQDDHYILYVTVPKGYKAGYVQNDAGGTPYTGEAIKIDYDVDPPEGMAVSPGEQVDAITVDTAMVDEGGSLRAPSYQVIISLGRDPAFKFVKKVGNSSISEPLAEQSFRVTHLDSCVCGLVPAVTSYDGVSDEKGRVSFDSLVDGHSYLLEETNVSEIYETPPSYIIKAVEGEYQVYDMANKLVHDTSKTSDLFVFYNTPKFTTVTVKTTVSDEGSFAYTAFTLVNGVKTPLTDVTYVPDGGTPVSANLNDLTFGDGDSFSFQIPYGTGIEIADKEHPGYYLTLSKGTVVLDSKTASMESVPTDTEFTFAFTESHLLPYTGGGGTTIFLICGILFMFIGAVLWIGRFRRKY